MNLALKMFVLGKLFLIGVLCLNFSFKFFKDNYKEKHWVLLVIIGIGYLFASIYLFYFWG